MQAVMQENVHRVRDYQDFAACAAVLTGAGPAMMLQFAPWHALIGGTAIGTLSAGKSLLCGRILGISGAVKYVSRSRVKRNQCEGRVRMSQSICLSRCPFTRYILCDEVQLCLL